jgi:hypothetical protein
LSVEFQWFLTALSVRPRSRRAIDAHLLPWRARAATTTASSQGENASFLTWGLSWEKREEGRVCAFFSRL